jgi:DNA processing protein
MNQPISGAHPIDQETLLYSIAFSMLPGMGEIHKNKLLQYYSTAKQIYALRKKGSVDWPLQEAQKELDFINKNEIACLTMGAINYPYRLAQIPDAPSVLYLQGSNAFQLPQLVSIIGTRQHTQQVHKVVQELMEGIQHLKMGVISGLALGVDGIAHASALQYQLPTWGVLAHGLDQIYPNAHRKLAKQMLAHGGLLTECRQNTITMPYQFPKRNRIVAGMSDATIVIESPIAGGSMITAKLASGYDREVFAAPGKIHDAKSKGCLWLIQNNIAQLYNDPIHLLEQMNWPQAPPRIQAPHTPSFLDPTAKDIYTYIQLNGPIHKDSLAQKMNLDYGSLASHLLSLELNGYIHLLAGNTYSCS